MSSSKKPKYEVTITFDSGTGEFHMQALDVYNPDAKYLDMNYICKAVCRIAENVISTLDNDQQETIKDVDITPSTKKGMN